MRNIGPAAGDSAGPAGHTGVEVALLDLDGVIVDVNDAWNAFCSANGGDRSRSGVGLSYLDACTQAGDPFSLKVAMAIRAALAGELPTPLRFDLRCDAPTVERAFDLFISSRLSATGTRLGAVITLSPVAEERPPPAASVPTAGDRQTAIRPTSGERGLNPAALARLVEAAPDGFAVVDDDGRITYANERLAELSGYDAGMLVGSGVELLVPEHARRRHGQLRAAARGTSPARLMGAATLTLRRRDGSFLPVEISLSPAPSGAAPVMVAIVRDVSARVALEERARIIADALDAVGDGVVVLDVASQRRLYANRAVLERVGVTAEELETVPIGAPATAEQALRIQAAVREVASGARDHVTLDTLVRHLDGGSLPVEMLISPAGPDAGGRSRERLVLVSRDIRQRLIGEERLRFSEESFRAAFEQSPIGTVVVQVDHGGARRIVRANAALGDLLGIPAAELVGRDFAEFTFAEDDAEDAAAAAATAEGRRDTYARRKRYRRADGSAVWVDLRSSAIDHHPGGGRTALSHLLDVTGPHRAEERRRRRACLAELVTAVTTAMLAGDDVAETYQAVADGVARSFGAAAASVLLPGPLPGQYRVKATAGLAGNAGVPAPRTIDPGTLRALAGADDAVPLPEERPAGGDRSAGTGPGAVARFTLNGSQSGLLVVTRVPGAEPFDDDTLIQLADFTRQLGLVVELGRARVDRERLALLEQRERLARDLHDTVIQDLISIGMALSLAQCHPDIADQHDATIRQLEAVIRRLRTAIFALKDTAAAATLTEAVAAVTTDASRALGHRPYLELTGVPDTVAVNSDLAGDLVAVLREALSNIARHAHATATAIHLHVDDTRVRLTVTDDGVGIDPAAQLGHGIGNIKARAAAHYGVAAFSSPQPTGTTVTWTVSRP